MRIGFTKRALTLVLALHMVVTACAVMTHVQPDTQTRADAGALSATKANDGAASFHEVLLGGMEEQSADPTDPETSGKADALMQSTASKPDFSEDDAVIHVDGVQVELEADMPQAVTHAGVQAEGPQAETSTAEVRAVDLTALRKAIALAPQIEARQDLIVGIFYTDYMNLVEEARIEYLEKANSFTQEQVDAMTDTLMTSYQRLKNGEYDKAVIRQNLESLIARYERLRVVNSNPETAFPVEGWLQYHTAVVQAKQLLETDAYHHDVIGAAIAKINKAYRSIQVTLMPGTDIPFPDFSESALSREVMINRVGFQVKSAYGGRTVRLAVNTVASFNVKKVVIVDENGLEVPVIISIPPANPHRPGERILYADIVLDTEPGMHTYTVYVCETNSQDKVVLFYSQPMQCSIRVK